MSPAFLSMCREDSIEGNTLLIGAAKARSVPLVEFLLFTKGADPSVCNHYGQTFLHAVCGASRDDERSYAAVEMVLNRCPHCVDRADQNGQSPLHISAIAGKREGSVVGQSVVGGEAATR